MQIIPMHQMAISGQSDHISDAIPQMGNEHDPIFHIV